jgi:hypothetical protein
VALDLPDALKSRLFERYLTKEAAQVQEIGLVKGT